MSAAAKYTELISNLNPTPGAIFKVKEVVTGTHYWLKRTTVIAESDQKDRFGKRVQSGRMAWCLATDSKFMFFANGVAVAQKGVLEVIEELSGTRYWLKYNPTWTTDGLDYTTWDLFSDENFKPCEDFVPVYTVLPLPIKEQWRREAKTASGKGE